MSSAPSHPRRRWPRLLLGGIVAIAALVALLLRYAVPALIPSAIIYAPNTKIVVDPVDDPRQDTLRKLGVAQALRVAAGPPAASISVWIVEPPARRTPRTPTVLVLHGIRDSKASMIGWGRRLAAAGFRAVLVDLRGHGRSGGRWLTYGVVDRHDLSQVVDALAARGLATPPLGVLGHSYGAAAGIQLAAHDPRVGAVVAVSSFSSLRDVVPLYVRRYLWRLADLVPRARVDQAVAEAGRLAEFDPAEASPLAAIRRLRWLWLRGDAATAAVLLVHGAEDRNIPPSHSGALHAAAPDHSGLIVVPGEGHNSIMADRTGTLMRHAIPWLQRYLR